MAKILRALFTCVAVIVPVNALAQEVPGAQFAAGYSHLGSPNVVPSNTTDETGDAPHAGWFAQVIGNVTPHAGLVAEVSGTYTRGTLLSRNWRGTKRIYTFLGGGRATSRCCRTVAPFAQVLTGFVYKTEKVNSNGGAGSIANYADRYFALMFGGGADVPLGRSIGLHVAADVVRIYRGGDYGGDYSPNTWRLHIGVVAPMR